MKDEQLDIKIYTGVAIDICFHNIDGSSTYLDLDEIFSFREEDGNTIIYYGLTDEGEPRSSVYVKESIEEIKQLIIKARIDRDRIYQNYLPVLIENFDPNLNNLRERKLGIAQIKQKVFNLVLDYTNNLTGVEENKKEFQRIIDELVKRVQDYNTFLHDPKKEQGLNFEDYDY